MPTRDDDDTCRAVLIPWGITLPQRMGLPHGKNGTDLEIWMMQGETREIVWECVGMGVCGGGMLC